MIPRMNVETNLRGSIPWKNANDNDEAIAAFHLEPHSLFSSQKIYPRQIISSQIPAVRGAIKPINVNVKKFLGKLYPYG